MEFIQARHYTVGRTSPIKLIVIHDMEYPERLDTAEAVAKWFAGPNAPQASTHYNIDTNSVVQSVRDRDTSWCAPGANSQGLHFEHAGYAKQSQSEWLDKYGKQMLDISAQLVAKKCLEYSIPIKHLTPSEMRAGARGICSHNDVRLAWGKTSHTDPGPNFPWDYYISRVKHFAQPSKPETKPDPVPPVTQKVKKMTTLVQLEGKDPVWVSDLITRRWIQSPAELSAVQLALKAAGLPTTVNVVKSLAPYGVVVGKEPS